jgi:hypothetical protein
MEMERRPLGLHAGNSSASRLAVLSGGTFFFLTYLALTLITLFIFMII